MTANNQICAFRDAGARRQLFDKVNAARKDADGGLTRTAIETPGLPTDYASRFFRSAPGDPTVPDPTIDSVSKDIADRENELTQAKDLLAKLQQAAADAKKAAEDKTAALAELAALEQQETDLKKQKDALKDKLRGRPRCRERGRKRRRSCAGAQGVEPRFW